MCCPSDGIIPAPIKLSLLKESQQLPCDLQFRLLSCLHSHSLNQTLSTLPYTFPFILADTLLSHFTLFTLVPPLSPLPVTHMDSVLLRSSPGHTCTHLDSPSPAPGSHNVNCKHSLEIKLLC